MNKSFLLVFLLLLPLLLFSQEKCTDNACFPQVKKLFGTENQLSIFSAADFNYLFYDVYSIALYLDDQHDLSILDQQRAKILSFEYHRNIEKERLVNGAIDTLKDNPEFNYPKYESQVAEINDYYSDVKEKDTLELHYHPEQGLSLVKQGKELVSLADKVFSNYYLGIWLGNYPLSKKIQRKLTNS